MTYNPISLRARLPRILILAAMGILVGAGTAQAEPSASPARHAGAMPPGYTCQQGEFCAWAGTGYSGKMQRFDLRSANPEECIPLPAGLNATSFANRFDDRSVTVYQDRECATHADFSTYPGGGTFVPDAPYVVRAIQVWN